MTSELDASVRQAGTAEGLASQQRTRRSALYRTLWRWHFYAGLLCLPLVLLLSVTGSIYLFKPQLDVWAERDFQQLHSSSPRQPANAQIHAAQAAVPDSLFQKYRLPQHSQQAVMIAVNRGGDSFQVYVNPYSLEVLQVRPQQEQLLQIVRNLHGELMLGTAGSLLVELVACWAIVLLLSGLYLWWPRGGQGLGGIVYPRLNLQGRRFWKDLHGVVGFWVSALALFLLLSGLPWTTVWGAAFKELRQLQAPRQVQQHQQQQGQHAGHREKQEIKQDWAQSQAATARSWGAAAVTQFDLTPALLARAQALNFAAPAELSVVDQHRNHWKLSSSAQNRPLRADAWLDGDSGAVSKMKTFAQRPLLDRIVGIGVAAHEGQLFGWFNQLLGVLTTLGLSLLCVSGFMLWRKRKPLGLGAPAAAGPAPKLLPLAVLALLAILLPMLAISLLALWLLEWCLIRRWRRLSQWLGMADSQSC